MKNLKDFFEKILPYIGGDAATEIQEFLAGELKKTMYREGDLVIVPFLRSFLSFLPNGDLREEIKCFLRVYVLGVDTYHLPSGKDVDVYIETGDLFCDTFPCERNDAMGFTEEEIREFLKKHHHLLRGVQDVIFPLKKEHPHEDDKIYQVSLQEGAKDSSNEKDWLDMTVSYGGNPGFVFTDEQAKYVLVVPAGTFK